jgi:hypothetical protein
MLKGVSARIVSGRNSLFFRLIVAVIVVVVAVLFVFLSNQSKDSTNSNCGAYRNDKIVAVNSEKITAEVVDTQEERVQGLSGRPCIEADKGMLFVYDKPGSYPFWMKDMKFPIDIVWVGSDHIVVDLDIDVSPSTYPDVLISKEPAQYVLELQANRSKNLKIELGTPVNF